MAMKISSLTLTDLLFDKASVGLCLVAPDSTVVRANTEWLRSTGFSEDQVVGENVIDLFPETRDMALAMHARARAGHRVEVPRHAQTVHGRETWWEGSIEPVPMAGGTGLLITAREVRPASSSHDVVERRAADDALRESEERYRTLFTKMLEGFAIGEAICDPDGKPVDFRLLEMNEAFERQSGLARDAARGRPMREVLPNLEQFWVETYCRVALGGPEVRFEHYNQDLDRHFSVYCFSPAPGRFAIMFNDITERRRADNAIRESEARLRRLSDSGMFGVVHFDLDGAVEDANDRFLEIVGYSRAELETGQIAWDRMTPPEYRAADEFAIGELESRGVDTPYEKEYIRKDGSRVPILIGAATYDDARHRGIAFVLDITERKRAEQAMLAQQKEAMERASELEAVLNCIADGVVVYDREGRTVRSNPAAEEILRIPARDRAAPFRDRVATQYEVRSEDGRLLAPEEMITYRASVYGEDARRVIRRVQPRDQQPHWLMMSAKPLVVAGEHKGAVLSMTDITERKQMEEALHEADRRKDEFLGMLSHELRNPLAPIRNSTYILQHAPPGSEQARRAQGVIERQTEHLTHLVDDLLDVTRVARGKIDLRRSRVDLRELVVRAGEDFRWMMRDRGVQFDVAVPDEPLWVDADGTRITQVVGNLLHNAAKFTRGADTVTLSLGQADRHTAEIRVRDTGAGIEPELLPRVFDAFVQGKRTLARTDGGLGLGLALVKGLIELHGGSVHVDSPGKGKGTEFTVRLPLEAALRPDARQQPAVTRQSGGRRVLVVDDNADAAESLADLIRMLGHSVEVAFDGPSAVEAAKATRPDMVLCDLGLPGMDGYEVAKTLRAAAMDGMQLIAISGYAQPEDVKKSAEAGFDAHLAKPCDPAQIERLLG